MDLYRQLSEIQGEVYLNNEWRLCLRLFHERSTTLIILEKDLDLSYVKELLKDLGEI